jgi:ABC-type lipoprotein export system ATPase subunit
MMALKQQDAHFTIRNLLCGYTDKQVVLSVRKLLIPKGKLTFVVGASGLGKSTLLEALGLMSRTMHTNPETQVNFFPQSEDVPQPLPALWAGGDAELAKFRRDHYSFIFQNTNLMPNFTAGENMCFTALISKISQQDAKSQVLQAMVKLGLEPYLFDRKTTELSGGQRQRIAFIRAIMARHSVLFGDEPTGNLDSDTSRRLMSFLKEQLMEHGRTGIIVSHDLSLALEFGDQLVVITPGLNPQTSFTFGEIHLENILYKQDGQWMDVHGTAYTNAENKVSALVKQSASHD